jgi:hypothetical protein
LPRLVIWLISDFHVKQSIEAECDYSFPIYNLVLLPALLSGS